jgi:predicted nucleotidyltransferase
MLQSTQKEKTMSPDVVIQQCIAFAKSDARLDVLWLYGSRAKGNAQEHSDYDFAVAFRYPEAASLRQRIEPELLAMEWADKLGLADHILSVVDINHLPLPLAYSIISTGKVLLTKDTLRQVREENRINSMWEIDYLYHRRHYG